MTPKLFSELGLSPELLKAIDKLGFEQASPIQAEAIPVLLAGKDIVGQSQTGSGKTAAFAIPAIEKTDPALKAVQVLVLCPTRELAVQVSEEVHKLALFRRGIASLPIYGGQSYERQFYGLKQGAQIVIGTPGRVMDHLDRGTLRLDQLKMIILDEADVMLDMGFREDIEKVLQSTPAERQTVFFSATMPKPIRTLIEKFAREPQSVKIEQKALTVPTVEQVFYEVDRRFKVELLTRLIDLHDLKLGIIFCNTKRMVDELVEHLEAQGYQADRLHGDMNQAQRDRVMNRFRKSGLEFLVATDVAARGIDVDDVEVVFNYDLPYDAEDYVHRIGRTGRAGRSGRAITFVSGREIFQIRNIERYTNMRVQRGRVPTLEEVDQARDNQVIGKVRATLQAGEFKAQDHLIERLLEEGYASTDLASALLHMLLEGETEDANPSPKKSLSPARTATPAGAVAKPDVPAGEPVAAPEVAKVAEVPVPPIPVTASTSDDASLPAKEQPVAETKPAAPKPVAPRVERPPQREPAYERPPRREPRDFERGSRPERGFDRAGDRGYRRDDRRPYRDERAGRPDRGYPRDDRPRSDDRREPRPFERRESFRRDDVPRREESPGIRERREPSRSVEPRHPAPRSEAPAPAPAKAPAERAVAETKPKSPKPEGLTRLHMNAGETTGVKAADVVNAIMGETGLPAKIVNKVDVREKHAFVEVAAEHAGAIIAKLNRAGIAGRKVKVKLA